MAKKGRKAKPTALKLVDGNPGNRPLPKDEPKPRPVYAPDPPAGFNDLEVAKWNEVSGKLAKIRILTELDLDALEIYVRNWIAMHEALNDINDRGKLLRTPGGSTMWNPSWSHYKHSESVCRSIIAEFGMTPSTRTGIVAIGDADGGNEWDDF